MYASDSSAMKDSAKSLCEGPLMSDTFDSLFFFHFLNLLQRQELDVGITAVRISRPWNQNWRKTTPREFWTFAVATLPRDSSTSTPTVTGGVNPYGFNADSRPLASGVTTAMDAGSSRSR